MDTVIIETAVSIVANLAVTLIGVLGAWLLSRIAKTQQLSTIGTAVGELTAAAEQTADTAGSEAADQQTAADPSAAQDAELAAGADAADSSAARRALRDAVSV